MNLKKIAKAAAASIITRIAVGLYVAVIILIVLVGFFPAVLGLQAFLAGAIVGAGFTTAFAIYDTYHIYHYGY